MRCVGRVRKIWRNMTHSARRHILGTSALGLVLASHLELPEGGLVGWNHNSSSISGSYANGNVDASLTYSGGLVGLNRDGSTITDSYATGNVSGANTAGGLTGRNDGASTIRDSYSTGSAAGTSNVGGLIGSNASAVHTSYWNTQTSGQATSDGGTGLTSAQMRQADSFTGWDIDGEAGTGTVWRIYEGLAAPILRSFLDPLTVKFKDKTAFAGLDFDLPELSASGLVVGKSLGILFGPSGLSGADLATPGTYSILPTGLYSPQQGYDITFAPGTLTLQPQTFNNITDPGRTQVKITYDFEVGHASMPDPVPEILWEIRESEWLEQESEAERLTLPLTQEE